MNREENIELDEMALSVIAEVASQLTGTQITTLTDKTGNKNIASASPEASNVPKAVVALPGSAFLSATYQVNLGDGNTVPIWEIFGPSVAKEMAEALGGSSGDGLDALGSFGSMAPPPSRGGGMQGSMGGGMANTGMMGGGMPNMSGMPNMGGANMGGFGMPNQATNVQSVQFPSLMPHAMTTEQGNIGLIMDVYMEMTVELGRTKKLIKEILGMGEGTIIELDKLAGEPVDILVNHKLIAKGEVVVIDENFGVRVTEIVSPMERMSDMG
jgi:flagellar motor switch protein FliN/FliY